jgi:hypothetical protein
MGKTAQSDKPSRAAKVKEETRDRMQCQACRTWGQRLYYGPRTILMLQTHRLQLTAHETKFRQYQILRCSRVPLTVRAVTRVFRRCSCTITAVCGYGTPLTLTSSHKSRKVTKFREKVVTAATLCRRQSVIAGAMQSG